MGALALTAKAAYREPFEPLPGDVTFVPYGDADALAAAVTDETAAVVLEPIQGEAGVVVAARRLPRGRTPDHPRARRAAVARRGADRHRPHRRLVRPPAADAGVDPDVVTLAKGLGGGIPIGACRRARRRPATLLQPGNHGTTFGGNPVALRRGARRARHDRDRRPARRTSTGLGAHLAPGSPPTPRVTEVRGEGLLIGARPRPGRRRRRGRGRGLDAGFILNATAPPDAAPRPAAGAHRGATSTRSWPPGRDPRGARADDRGRA